MFLYSAFVRRRVGWMWAFRIQKFVKTDTNVNVSKTNEEIKKCFFAEKPGLFIPLSLSIFGLASSDEETPEDKLITIIKRSVLCIQREQYDKAEKMLHLALRMAQDLQSREGITYVYDVMANLAMEREQYKKAEKLYTEILKRLLEDGFKEDSAKVLHISSKVAHMAEQQGDLNKSMIGFTWTIKKLEDSIEKMPDSDDLKELLGLTQYWFGQLLMKLNNFEEARTYFKYAYDCFIKTHGPADEESITILNNLCVACVKLEKYSEAKSYLMEALKVVRTTNDSPQEAILQANLGLILLKQGLIDEAKTVCSQAWRTGTKKKDSASIEQAEYCLNEIKRISI